MNTMTITEKEAKRYKFPAKTIGTWKQISEHNGERVYQRLKQDGTLGSDRPNNILKVKVLTIEEFLEAQNKYNPKQITAKKDNKEVVIAESHTVDNEPKVEKPTEANIKMNDEIFNKPITADQIQGLYNIHPIGTRLARWIAQLIEVMKSEPLTRQLIWNVGDLKIIDRIVQDQRAENKPYSSIATAMRVWNTRIKRGEYGAQ